MDVLYVIFSVVIVQFIATSVRSRPTAKGTVRAQAHAAPFAVQGFPSWLSHSFAQKMCKNVELQYILDSRVKKDET